MTNIIEVFELRYKQAVCKHCNLFIYIHHAEYVANLKKNPSSAHFAI